MATVGFKGLIKRLSHGCFHISLYIMLTGQEQEGILS